MESPCQTLLRWLVALPESLQQELAELVVSGLPHLQAVEKIPGSEDSPQSLVAYLGRHSGGAPEDALVAAAIAGAIDVVFFGRSTRADWQQAREAQQALARCARAGEDEELVRFAEQGLQHMKVRADQWMEAARSWDGQRSGDLSASAMGGWIRSFFNEEMFQRALSEGQ